MPLNAAIAIICKVPTPGHSKTRLIPALGAEGAAALSRAFLVDLSGTICAAAESVGGRGYAVCSPASAVPALSTFLPANFGYVIRTNPVLGRVLDGAVADLLARGHDSVVLVNGDSPTLPLSLLTGAVEALRRRGRRVVFGPALDGGYTLVGLAHREPDLFDDIPWSTAAVLESSLTRARQLCLEATVLPTWYDVDDAESLAWLRTELAGRVPQGLTLVGAQAAATREVLARVG